MTNPRNMPNPRNRRPEGTPPGTKTGRVEADVHLTEVDYSTYCADNLNDDEYDLLRIVGELQTDTTHPSTHEVGERLQADLQQRGGAYSFHRSAPWWGTRDTARRLEDLGLLEVHINIAKFHERGEPTPTVDRFWLEVTPAGLTVLDSGDQ